MPRCGGQGHDFYPGAVFATVFEHPYLDKSEVLYLADIACSAEQGPIKKGPEAKGYWTTAQYFLAREGFYNVLQHLKVHLASIFGIRDRVGLIGAIKNCVQLQR